MNTPIQTQSQSEPQNQYTPNVTRKITARLNWITHCDGAMYANPLGLRYGYYITSRYRGSDYTRIAPAGKHLLYIVDSVTGMCEHTIPKIGSIKYLKAFALKHYRFIVLGNLSQNWLNWYFNYLAMEAKAS